tara:strand:- start:1265 stop:1654 length:390 start_codon:yes stop_codon:yes gene_type:complete
MANHKGSEGVVKIGANTISEVKDWSLSETADTIEDTTMGDVARTRQPSLTSASGSLSCFWDETDANGQIALQAGTEVALKLYPEGATTGDYFASVQAIITSQDASASMDGMVEATFSWESNGAVTWATV